MSVSATISKTDLARRTRQAMDQVRRGRTLIVESYGEEQAVLMDILDYRLLRAVASYRTLPSHPAPVRDEALSPRGLRGEDVKGDLQTTWNRVIAAYLDGDISLGRAAELLALSRFELAARFNRLGLPLPPASTSVEEAGDELHILRSRQDR